MEAQDLEGEGTNATFDVVAPQGAERSLTANSKAINHKAINVTPWDGCARAITCTHHLHILEDRAVSVRIIRHSNSYVFEYY